MVTQRPTNIPVDFYGFNTDYNANKPPADPFIGMYTGGPIWTPPKTVNFYKPTPSAAVGETAAVPGAEPVSLTGAAASGALKGFGAAPGTRAQRLAYALQTWPQFGAPKSIAEAAVQGIGSGLQGWMAGSLAKQQNADKAAKAQRFAAALFPEGDPRRAQVAGLLESGDIEPSVFGPALMEKYGLDRAKPIEGDKDLIVRQPDGSYKVVYKAPVTASTTTDDLKEYDFAVKQGYKGSLVDFIKANKLAGATQINTGSTGIDYGSPGEGMAWKRGADGKVETDDRGAPIAIPYQGGKAMDAQKKEMVAAKNAMDGLKSQWQVMEGSVDQAIADIDKYGRRVAGIGSLGASIPDTPAYNLAETLKTIQANVGFDKLAEMRASSPSGGALGQVSNFENLLLQAVKGSLAQGQDPERLKANLLRIKELRQALQKERESAFAQTYAEPAVSVTPSGRPRAVNGQGQAVEFDGTQWVPAP